ncbi:MAG TPA: hypothetical protein VJC39_05175 [Candidatus Nanoarchaeia archaeon]|nr:hypothetical protein [Candidatus Nanoarchaeia archaeon]
MFKNKPQLQKEISEANSTKRTQEIFADRFTPKKVNSKKANPPAAAQFKGNNPRLNPYKKYFNIFLVVIAVALVVAFVIRPSIIGFGVYQETKTGNYSLDELGSNVQELKFKLELAENNLSLQSNYNSNLETELAKKNQALTECLARKGSLEDSRSLYDQNVELFKDKINLLENVDSDEVAAIQHTLDLCTEEKSKLEADNLGQEEFDKLKQEYELIVKNSALNICCKKKIDDPEINSYRLINNKIVCQQDGEVSLSCFG